ncbi:MAG: stage V sporulation protein AD [Clostridia bacterium]|nr:stage V sporulation protein AD [Clostridia bacterium]MBR0406633.1 stage V sporulation protein AD [Clostridia bacterium]
MPQNRVGDSTLVFHTPPRILSSAAVVGPKEGRGPLGAAFDLAVDDALYGQKSYEQAEHAIFQEACERCLNKANVPKERVQALLGGDLLNQIMAASLAARELSIPFLGLYGACSTMAESLILGSILVDGGYADPVLCAAGSHYCTAERQYRFPLEYGNQRTMAAQWTVTGTGACLLGRAEKAEVSVTMATIGQVVDMGIRDANNMGAAMAPAAADTLKRHFLDTGRKPQDYDQVITGDLGQVGSQILSELMEESGFPLQESRYMDCGLCIFDPQDDVHAGASGCGCSASVLSAMILPRLRSGEWKRVLFMATGALLSPTTSQQGETIPGVAHAAVLEGGDAAC